MLTVLIGKFLQKATKLRGGGGSALPGLFVERTNPKFLQKTLGRLKYGVVLVSGTNGKTTTTKIVAELLEGAGLKVFTNDSGGNFVRGVISAILKHGNWRGKLDADIAVLELDEAHAQKFIDLVQPNYSLLLNVMRDQLDRFGEIDHTAKLLHEIAKKTTGKVISNREDKRLNNIENAIFFGLAGDMKKVFKEDDDLLDSSLSEKKSGKDASVILEKTKDDEAFFNIGRANLKLRGVYNAFNSAGALALVKEILPEVENEFWLEKLSQIKPAFGRGEKIGDMEIILVKNPSGFQLALESFAEKNPTLIVINDEYADGRDVSWLWNVDFSNLKNREIITSGVRASDMALRLKYDKIKVEKNEEDLKKAIEILQEKSGEKYIFCTYTAMLKIRKILTGKSIQ